MTILPFFLILNSMNKKKRICEKPQVIALRYKKFMRFVAPFVAILSIVYFAVIAPLYRRGDLDGLKFWIFTFIIVCLVFFFFCFLFTPKTAITKEGETLVLHKFWRKKVIPLDAIQYVSFDEIGTLWTRDWELSDYLIVKNDIRTLWIIYRENGTEKKEFTVLCENATAAAISIETLLEKRKAGGK